MEQSGGSSNAGPSGWDPQKVSCKPSRMGGKRPYESGDEEEEALDPPSTSSGVSSRQKERTGPVEKAARLESPATLEDYDPQTEQERRDREAFEEAFRKFEASYKKPIPGDVNYEPHKKVEEMHARDARRSGGQTSFVQFLFVYMNFLAKKRMDPTLKTPAIFKESDEEEDAGEEAADTPEEQNNVMMPQKSEHSGIAEDNSKSLVGDDQEKPQEQSDANKNKEKEPEISQELSANKGEGGISCTASGDKQEKEGPEERPLQTQNRFQGVLWGSEAEKRNLYLGVRASIRMSWEIREKKLKMAEAAENNQDLENGRVGEEDKEKEEEEIGVGPSSYDVDFDYDAPEVHQSNEEASQEGLEREEEQPRPLHQSHDEASQEGLERDEEQRRPLVQALQEQKEQEEDKEGVGALQEDMEQAEEVEAEPATRRQQPSEVGAEEETEEAVTPRVLRQRPHQDAGCQRDVERRAQSDRLQHRQRRPLVQAHREEDQEEGDKDNNGARQGAMEREEEVEAEPATRRQQPSAVRAEEEEEEEPVAPRELRKRINRDVGRQRDVERRTQTDRLQDRQHRPPVQEEDEDKEEGPAQIHERIRTAMNKERPQNINLDTMELMATLLRFLKKHKLTKKSFEEKVWNRTGSHLFSMHNHPEWEKMKVSTRQCSVKLLNFVEMPETDQLALMRMSKEEAHGICQVAELKKRTIFTAFQSEELRKVFVTSPIPSTDELADLQMRLKLDVLIIREWFSTKRKAAKRANAAKAATVVKKEELE